MVSFIFFALAAASGADPVMLTFGEPAPTVDLGAGLWATPMPMDWDGDGDLDMLIDCTDKPYNGIWMYENPGDAGAFPVFKAGVKVGPGLKDAQVSYVNGEARVLAQNEEYVDFRRNGFTVKREICDAGLFDRPKGRSRAVDWKLADYDGDGDQDILIGLDYWEDYGWDDGYDAEGHWVKGLLHGYVYLIRNTGTEGEPRYQKSEQLRTADGNVLDTFGKPVPNLADFDGDGDMDLICGEFVDSFTYFENTGTRGEPKLAPGRKLVRDGKLLTMDLCMIVPVTLDWDKDGDADLIVGDEDGRVAWLENATQPGDTQPKFFNPRYLQQQGGPVKCGALATPFALDWDGDGDQDLLSGNTAGYIRYFENLGGANPPRFGVPVKLMCRFPALPNSKPESENTGQGESALPDTAETLRLQAGPNGSIQGPAERKWGYSVFTAADWDGDGRTDLIVNSIWGKVLWYRNPSGPGAKTLDAAQPVRVAWEGNPPKPAWVWWTPGPEELVTQWRTTPFAIDWNKDGLMDPVMLDPEGYLAFYERFHDAKGEMMLYPPKRIFTGADGQPLRLNDKERGKSGRRKFSLVDWDGDGAVDLLLNSVSVDLWKNTGTDPLGHPRFEDQGSLTDAKLEGHDTCPTVVDWNRDGKPELLIGAEDGHFYYVPD